MKRIKHEDLVSTPSFYTTLSTSTIQHSSFISQLTSRTKILKGIESKHLACPILEDDVCSHFSLRLICSQSLFAKKWFSRYETEYFKRRLEKLDLKTLKDYFFEMLLNISNITEIDGITYINWNSCIKKNFFSTSYKIDDSVNFKSFNTSIDNTSIFEYIKNDNEIDLKSLGKQYFYKQLRDNKIKIYFSKICDVLHKSKIEKGFIILDDENIISSLTNFFRRFIDEKTMSLYQKMKKEPDERLLKIHNDLFRADTPNCKSSSLNQIEKYLPPCISGLLKKLKTVNHLKYKDRLVLTRFLKDAGLSVQECTHLFRSNFKNIDEIAFNKDYLYSIRHSYGLEGKRASYHSYSCKQMIELSKDKEAFGCPFVNNQKYINEYSSIKEIEINIEETPQKSCCNALSKFLNIDLENFENSPVNFLNKYKEKQGEDTN
ncbi:DNA primase subunit pri2 [Gurleya vavrai]